MHYKVKKKICNFAINYVTHSKMEHLSNRVQQLAASQTLAMSQRSAELKAQGIEDFIHVRVNVLDTLIGFNAKLLK